MTTMNQGGTSLQGSWTHSFEEDEADGIEVYRPTHSFAFPAARRGRESLDFSAGGGQVEHSMPGADDRPRSSSAGATALGMNRYRLGGKVIEVLEMTSDRLRLRVV